MTSMPPKPSAVVLTRRSRYSGAMNDTRHRMPLLLLGLFLVSSAGLSQVAGQSSNAPPAQTGGAREWRFAVSGDSRNCGDIVMPAIAREVNGNQSQFYWH